MANIGKAVKLGVFTLAIMNVTAVVSLRGLPAEAVYGLSSAFYYLFAAIVFLIPTSLVAAELAAMFQDKQGGRRGLWKEMGFPGYLGTMDREYDLVSDRIDFRCCIHRLYWDERCARYDAGFKQNVYAGCRIDYLLARYVYLFERSELGR